MRCRLQRAARDRVLSAFVRLDRGMMRTLMVKSHPFNCLERRFDLAAHHSQRKVMYKERADREVNNHPSVLAPHFNEKRNGNFADIRFRRQWRGMIRGDNNDRRIPEIGPAESALEFAEQIIGQNRIIQVCIVVEKASESCIPVRYAIVDLGEMRHGPVNHDKTMVRICASLDCLRQRISCPCHVFGIEVKRQPPAGLKYNP